MSDIPLLQEPVGHDKKAASAKSRPLVHDALRRLAACRLAKLFCQV